MDVRAVLGGRPAVDGLSLQIESGEAVAIVGPSGAGKTTLLRLLNGAVRPIEGTVAVCGRPLVAMTPGELRRTRASIGFVHQDLRLVPNLRVIRNVMAGRLGRLSLAQTLRLMLIVPRPVEHEIHEVLSRVGIGHKLYERTDRLSGGERQRVAIARALYQRPMALLADEPVASVDPARARDTVELLTSICRESGLTLCVSLHNLDLAREFFPRLVGLRRGRLAFDAQTTQVGTRQFEDLYRLDSRDRRDGEHH